MFRNLQPLHTSSGQQYSKHKNIINVYVLLGEDIRSRKIKERLSSRSVNFLNSKIVFTCLKNIDNLRFYILTQGSPDVLLFDINEMNETFRSNLKYILQVKKAKQFILIGMISPHLRSQKYKIRALGFEDVLMNDFYLRDLYDRMTRKLKSYRERITLEQTLSFHRQSKEDVFLETIQLLCTVVAHKDDTTGEHVSRVGEYTNMILSEMDINEEDAFYISEAAKLHDIGKIYIPEKILLKKSKLTDKEFEIIKTHTEKGFLIIKDCKFNPILSYAKDIVKYHHEKWDGSGYPDGLSGNKIPLFARVVAIADVFDALIHKRCYRPTAFKIDEAVGIIKEQRGKHFDPKLVDIFLKIASSQTA